MHLLEIEGFDAAVQCVSLCVLRNAQLECVDGEHTRQEAAR
jgi:hypothetical protein